VWWDRSELLDVYLAPTFIGLASRRVEAVSWTETDGLDDAIGRLAGALAGAPWQSCGRVRVWLGSVLARPLMLSAASGARNRREAKGLAAMLAPDATGVDGAVRVWANAWRANRGGLAVVMPDSVWTALDDAIEQVRTERARTRHKDVARALELVSVRPWWNQVMDAVIEDSVRDGNCIGWSLTEGRGVVHGIVDRGKPVEAGFDLLGEHDVDGSLLRRRLQVNWDSTTASRHLEFDRRGHCVDSALGGWRTSGEGIA
jgi:hypothetical protein